MKTTKKGKYAVGGLLQQQQPVNGKGGALKVATKSIVPHAAPTEQMLSDLRNADAAAKPKVLKPRKTRAFGSKAGQVTGSRAVQLKQQKQKANATPVEKSRKIVGRAMGRKQPVAMQMPRNIKGMR